MSESLRLEVRRLHPLPFNLHTLQNDKLPAVQTAARLIYSKLFYINGTKAGAQQLWMSFKSLSVWSINVSGYIYLRLH